MTTLMYSDLLYMDTTGIEASIQVTKLSVIQTEVETVWSLVSLVSNIPSAEFSKVYKCKIHICTPKAICEVLLI